MSFDERVEQMALAYEMGRMDYPLTPALLAWADPQWMASFRLGVLHALWTARTPYGRSITKL